MLSYDQIFMESSRRRSPGLVVAACCLAVGGALLVLANTVSGEHARGNWVPPAKELGALLLLGGVYVAVWIAVARRSRRR